LRADPKGKACRLKMRVCSISRSRLVRKCAYILLTVVNACRRLRPLSAEPEPLAVYPQPQPQHPYDRVRAAFDALCGPCLRTGMVPCWRHRGDVEATSEVGHMDQCTARALGVSVVLTPFLLPPSIAVQNHPRRPRAARA